MLHCCNGLDGFTCLCVFFRVRRYRIYYQIASGVIAVDLVLVIFLSRKIHNQFKSLCRARLIKENHLLYVPAAISNDENSIDIYFSPFGVLLADMVIAFDVGKNRLFGVDISGDVAIIKYGINDIQKTLKIPGFEMQSINLTDLTNKLKFESGVTLNLLK